MTHLLIKLLMNSVNIWAFSLEKLRKKFEEYAVIIILHLKK